MNPRNKSKSERNPFFWNKNISVFDEMTHGKDIITVGTPLRFKYQRGSFKFVKLVVNSETNVSWIDCIDTKNGVFRSFYVDQLRGVIKPKRQRKKISVGT
jgi:hypothetical protein